ncbi:HAD domain-containing protein [Leifsonia xyli]|uniref:HAD domain-containing protein n=1 Tax=Leifsonia xyli TaxID=1575 RepID=UPI003D674956
MRTLIPSPTSPDPEIRVLVVLDVDGVLNTFISGEPAAKRVLRPGRWVPRGGREPLYIQFDTEIIDALDEQVHRPGVQLAWLTTWAVDLQSLISVAFDDRLSGGFMMAARPDTIFVPEDWKHRALLDSLDLMENPAYVWADDDAVRLAMMTRPAFADSSGRGGGNRLLIPTDPEHGLTFEDIDRIRDFIDTHA